LGYTTLRDVIFILGHEIGRTTVRRILAEDGIEPAPERRKHMPWTTFLKAHWGAIAAMNFFKVEVMTLVGPVRYSVLVVMDLKTRHVEVAGIVHEAHEKWMIQVLRNLTGAVDGFLIGKTHLIMDRGPVFTAGVRDLLRHAGTKSVRLSRCSPNLKGYAPHCTSSVRFGTTFTLHLFRTIRHDVEKATPFREFSALRFDRQILAGMLVQALVLVGVGMGT